MKITNISNIEFDTEIKVQGFVENIRNKNNIAFLVVKDITGKLQITILKKETDKFNALLEKLTIQSVVSIVGAVKKAEAVKLGGCEMIPSEITIEALSATPLPVDELSLIDQRLDYR
jgi:aspartyl-tRNA synthetase